MSNVRRQSEFVLAASIRDQLSWSRKACSFSSCPSLIYSSASVTLPVLRSLPSLSSSGTDSSTIWPELTKLRFVCSRRDAPILTYQLRLFTSLRHETHWPLPQYFCMACKIVSDAFWSSLDANDGLNFSRSAPCHSAKLMAARIHSGVTSSSQFAQAVIIATRHAISMRRPRLTPCNNPSSRH